jgi:hypothetical protein
MDEGHVIVHHQLRSLLWEVAPSALAGSFRGEGGEVFALLKSTMATAIVVPAHWCTEWAVEALFSELRSRAPTLLVVAVVLAASIPRGAIHARRPPAHY